MIEFIPHTLENEIIDMLNKLDFLEGEIDGISFDDIKNKNAYESFDEQEITEKSEIYLEIGEDSYPLVTIKFLREIIGEWDSAKMNSTQSYAKSFNKAYFLLKIDDYDDCSFIDTILKSNNSVVKKEDVGRCLWNNSIVVDNKTYEVSLYNGICLYHLLVQKSGNYDEYLPSYSDNDYFVRVVCDGQMDFSVTDNLANSFVFELNSTHNLSIEFSNGRYDIEFVDYDDKDISEESLDIFPLIYGRGMNDIFTIYNNAKTTYELDYKILGFTKVIEFIAPTVANEKLYKAVRLKLTSPSVFAPNSAFINELGELYKKHQNDISKDSELIRLTILTVLEYNDVYNLLPEYIKFKKIEEVKLTDQNIQKEQLEALAEAIYDTRNEIAHAKANYKKKEKECPEKQKEEYIKLLDFIAVKCIRWLAIQPDEKRVIL